MDYLVFVWNFGEKDGRLMLRNSLLTGPWQVYQFSDRAHQDQAEKDLLGDPESGTNCAIENYRGTVFFGCPRAFPQLVRLGYPEGQSGTFKPLKSL